MDHIRRVNEVHCTKQVVENIFQVIRGYLAAGSPQKLLEVKLLRLHDEEHFLEFAWVSHLLRRYDYVDQLGHKSIFTLHHFLKYGNFSDNFQSRIIIFGEIGDILNRNQFLGRFALGKDHLTICAIPKDLLDIVRRFNCIPHEWELHGAVIHFLFS